MVSELAKEIAELCGIKIHYAAYDTKEQWPTYIPSGKPVRTHSIDLRPIPEPDRDRAACMELLDFILSHPDVKHAEMNKRGVWYQFWVTLFRPDTRVSAVGETMTEAAAKACRDALRTLKEQKP